MHPKKGFELNIGDEHKRVLPEPYTESSASLDLKILIKN
jgi:hypothetical protein